MAIAWALSIYYIKLLITYFAYLKKASLDTALRTIKLYKKRSTHNVLLAVQKTTFAKSKENKLELFIPFLRSSVFPGQ